MPSPSPRYAAVTAAFERAQAAACGEATPSPSALADAFESVLGGSAAGLTFECCPTSSRATNGWSGAEWREHPLALLHRAHAAARAAGDEATAARLPRATISSDDPAVFLASITDEYTRTRNRACLHPCPRLRAQPQTSSSPSPRYSLVAEAMGLGVHALRDLAHNAIDAAFVSKEHKAALHARLDTEAEAWTAMHAIE